MPLLLGARDVLPVQAGPVLLSKTGARSTESPSASASSQLMQTGTHPYTPGRPRLRGREQGGQSH